MGSGGGLWSPATSQMGAPASVASFTTPVSPTGAYNVTLLPSAPGIYSLTLLIPPTGTSPLIASGGSGGGQAPSLSVTVQLTVLPAPPSPTLSEVLLPSAHLVSSPPPDLPTTPSPATINLPPPLGRMIPLTPPSMALTPATPSGEAMRGVFNAALTAAAAGAGGPPPKLLLPKQPILSLTLQPFEGLVSACATRLAGSGFDAATTPTVSVQREALLYANKAPISALSTTTLPLGYRLRDSAAAAPLPLEDAALQPLYVHVSRPGGAMDGSVSFSTVVPAATATATTTLTPTLPAPPTAMSFQVRGGVGPVPAWQEWVSSVTPTPNTNATVYLPRARLYPVLALPTNVSTLGLSHTAELLGAVPLPFSPLLPALAAPSSNTSLPLFALPATRLTALDNASLASAYAATVAAASGPYLISTFLTLPRVSRGAPKGGGASALPGHGLTLRLWREGREWAEGESKGAALALAMGGGYVGGVSPILAPSLVPSSSLLPPTVLTALGGCSDASTVPCLETPTGPLAFTSLWSTPFASPARVATWTGFVTPPPPTVAGTMANASTLSHTVSFVLLCDGPCALEFEGGVIASSSPLGGLVQTPGQGPLFGASGGGGASPSSTSASASALPPSQAAALSQCVFPGLTTSQGLTGTISPPLPLVAGSPYSLRVVLRVDEGRNAGVGGGGLVALLWELGQSASEDTRASNPNQCGSATLVPTSAFSWGVEEMQGSPVPAWVGV